jgi:hypothetical protein
MKSGGDRREIVPVSIDKETEGTTSEVFYEYLKAFSKHHP